MGNVNSTKVIEECNGKQLKIAFGSWGCRYEIWEDCDTRYPVMRSHYSDKQLAEEDWERILREPKKERKITYANADGSNDELPW